jgi:Mrp family chromosome partitioning ATPase
VSQSKVAKLELRVIERREAPLASESAPPVSALAVRPDQEATLVPAENAPPPISVVEEAVLPQALDPRLVVLREPGSARARSYRLLQHRLAARSDPRVIAVTSASPGEGKTTCAANLGLVLADQGFARVLLVETNVLRPSLGKLFGFEPAASFIDRIVRGYDARSPYQVARIRHSRLHVAALRSDTQRQLHVGRLQLGFALWELRRYYDYVVLDAASVFDSADAQSRRGMLRRALAQLSPAPVLGVALLET